MKIQKKTIFLIILVLGLLGATIAIASRLILGNPLDSSLATPKPKATFQKQVEIAMAPTLTPTSVPTLAPETSVTPTETLLSTQITPTPTLVISPTTALTSGSTTATPAPTEVILAESQVTPTTTSTGTTTLPDAGTTQYSFFIFLAAALTVVISLLY